MAIDGNLKDLVYFFKQARHLWGRCPNCGELFRLSEAAISYGAQPPKDWLKRLQKEKRILSERLIEIEEIEAELEGREEEVEEREGSVDIREKNLNREVKKLAYEYLKSDERIKKLVQTSRQEAVFKSRATLLGKLFERLAPFLQRFNHDPRDIRPIMEPVDYVCFDGLTVDRRVNRITFVEVKSGISSLSPPERSIVQAVQEGRVKTEVWHFGKKSMPLEQQLRLPKPR